MNILDEILSGRAWQQYVTPLFWDGKFENQVNKCYKISICTTCMNRLVDLRQTLPKNIDDNVSYPNIEFVLLDYNSSDGLENWVRNKMRGYIEDGTLVYYRTEQPKFYSMSHSRNIAFKLATGTIVNNVDADNFTNPGFAAYINKLAHQVPERCIFAKGKKMLRGRLGFYKNEFINLLGGYNEELQDYGHEDHNLVQRAWGLGFRMAWFGGKFFDGTGSARHQTEHYIDKNWKYTEKKNKMLSFLDVALDRFEANKNKPWGKAKLIKNFTEGIEV